MRLSDKRLVSQAFSSFLLILLLAVAAILLSSNLSRNSQILSSQTTSP